jgi:hypothetical protein
MRFDPRPVRIVSLLVLLAITNVYVFANGVVATKTSEASSKALLGRLVTNSNRPILVNGGEAITGAVILSGARLVTPLVGGATVQLDKLGSVSVAPNSTVTLAFDAKNVTVRVASGNASVSTVEGVTGVVVGPNGAAVPAAPVPTDADTARNWGIAGVAVGSAAFIWALIAWNKANDADDRAAALEAQLAALRACLATQAVSPVRVCTSF